MCSEHPENPPQWGQIAEQLERDVHKIDNYERSFEMNINGSREQYKPESSRDGRYRVDNSHDRRLHMDGFCEKIPSGRQIVHEHQIEHVMGEHRKETRIHEDVHSSRESCMSPSRPTYDPDRYAPEEATLREKIAVCSANLAERIRSFDEYKQRYCVS